LFQLDDPGNHDLKLEHIIEKGRTYNLEHMPKLLWVSTGERLPDLKSFEKLRQARNAVQHFCSPTNVADLRKLALTFLYKNIDPLIKKHFDLYAIEYHEDTGVSYDYVVGALIRQELLFSVPEDFEVTEIRLDEALKDCSIQYKNALAKRFKAAGLDLKKVMQKRA
jgi:hypothetical protein